MSNQEILDNAPEWADTYRKLLDYPDCATYANNAKDEQVLDRSLADIRRIAELENQCISVEDRLPGFHKQILFYAGKIDGSIRGALYRHSHRFQDAGGNFFYKSGVTHWMPLPEPPKEQK